ncbi:MAG: transglutaminase-like cysteine peptidase [Burkholderiaceae bacterium]
MTDSKHPCPELAHAWLLGLLLLSSAGLAWGTDLSKTLSLAQQRYGSSAAHTVQAWRRLIDDSRSLSELDKLERANAFFNRHIVFASDALVWQREDYWATPLELMGRGRGDCEDYAIAKYMTLQLMGVGHERLRIIYVEAQTDPRTSQAHMVLGYYQQPNQEPLILDNLWPAIHRSSIRSDLTPIFSFNHVGFWLGAQHVSLGDPTIRLSRWRDLLQRMREDGLLP